ncbi:hypothetical protein NQZ68_031889 [Dissostichus eleginoides]|nr:hypothetical protein NQZ68_031889 [Dissostichus eleginoides]
MEQEPEKLEQRVRQRTTHRQPEPRDRNSIQHSLSPHRHSAELRQKTETKTFRLFWEDTESKWSANRSTETDPQGAPKVDGLTYILRKTLRAAA